MTLNLFLLSLFTVHSNHLIFSELGALFAIHCAIILTGYFKIHIINCTNPLTTDFNSSFDRLGFNQFVNVPTHRNDYTLDLVWDNTMKPHCHMISHLRL